MGPADEQGASVERRLLEKLMNQCVLSNPQRAARQQANLMTPLPPLLHAGLRRVAAALNAAAGP